MSQSFRNPLVRTLFGLRGNPKAAIWTEPFWGISMALVLPYLSVFMLQQGLADQQIGLLATIGMVSQMFWGLASGIITDKLGRRWTTLVFDILAWAIPSLIWAVSQNFWYFFGAALVNGTWQVVQNSWDCLLVEDADRKEIPRLYSLVKVASDCSALFAPIAVLLVAKWGLEHAVRVLFVNAAIMMTVKAILLFKFSEETTTGRTRMAETRGIPFTTLLIGYKGVIGNLMLRSKGTMFALAIMALIAAVTLVNGTFWPVVVTGRLGVPEAVLPVFPMVRSLLSILLFFTIIPRLTHTTNMRRPTVYGFAVYLLGQVLLVLIPAHSTGTHPHWYVYALLGGTLLLDAFGAGVLYMLSESLVALHVDEAERSRVMAIQRMAVQLFAAPFGWIAGWLSGVGRAYPFVLTSALLAIGLLLTLWKWVPTHDGDADTDAVTATLPANPLGATMPDNARP